MEKKAIRYLRFSDKKQSENSIERQRVVTDHYIQLNKINLIDTFIDRGRSAKTFDRPDFIKLQEFISLYHKNVDYLLVDQMDRFSRDAGEAMGMVKTLQSKYGIQIISVSEGIEFDYDKPGSFFRAGLQLLLAEEDNINRSIKIRSGIYSKKTKEGKFVFRITPFGYDKIGEPRNRRLIINEPQAKIVRFIYDAYLKNVPLYLIKQRAEEIGFDRKGNMAVERVLNNPVYAGLVYAKAYKEHPGGLFPAIHEPIIDMISWKMVQSKFKSISKPRTIVDDSLPLRGILKCHCGNLLTGAPSRGKSGQYFYYYKCRFSKHNNISAKKAHMQFDTALELMSLPARSIQIIKDSSKKEIEKELEHNRKVIAEKKLELTKERELLYAVEEKWIKSEIDQETYKRWHNKYKTTIDNLEISIERLNTNHSEAYEILNKELELLTDLKSTYHKFDTLEKREFIDLVFDSNLYYENGMYRTPTMMNILSSKRLKMRELEVLIVNKKREDFSILPSSALVGIRTPNLLIRSEMLYPIELQMQFRLLTDCKSKI